MGHRAAIALYMLFALFPLYWLVKIAVTPDKLLYTEGIRLWPSSTTLANFAFVLLQSDFPAFFVNSVMVSLGTALGVTIVASGAGYAFSRFHFPGKYIVVFILLLTQMFPLVMLIAPIYRLMTPLGLTDNLIGLIITYTAFNVPFATFLMQSFFDGIPEGAGRIGDDRWLHPLSSAAPGDFSADAARHGCHPRLRVHRRLVGAAVRADADQQRGKDDLRCRPPHLSSPNSRSIGGR